MLADLQQGWIESLTPWATVVAAGVLMVLGFIMATLFARNRSHSFVRDLLLLLALLLPLMGTAMLLTGLPPDSPWTHRGQALLLFAVALVVSYGVGRLLVTGIRAWSARSEAVRSVRGTLEVMARAVSLVIGALVLLDMLKVSIAPLLTTLGIGSLAVALALQDTLSNFFAGLHLTADRPLREGDYIRLDSGEEGHVITVGWRSARLRTPANNVIVVPNAKLARASITNFDLPERRLAITIRVPIAYGQDSRKAERVLAETLASAAGQVPGLLAEPTPTVLFHPGFGDLALEFSVTCHVASFDQQLSVQHELRHRFGERLRQEGIELMRMTRL
ncbi:MAG: mechanosensitive ion channel family protein [Planctomycetes bacterium]|nr:mechanosensitive ion channel family protein [Planctomycetota bacterium]